MDDRKQHGVVASSHEYANYDQVNKPAYRLAEQDAGEEAFDDDFVIRTCDLRGGTRPQTRPYPG